MEDEWWPLHEQDTNELCYGVPTDARQIPHLMKKILISPYVDSSQGFDLEIILDLDQLDEELLDEELLDEEPGAAEAKVAAIIETLRGRLQSVLKETDRRFHFRSDLSGWDEGYATVVEYTKNVERLIECITYLVSQSDLFEYCTLGVSLYLTPVSQLSEDMEFGTVCKEIEKRTGGQFSIRGKAELGPYDGIKAGSSFYQTFLLVSPLYEFPLQFFRGHSEDNRLAGSFFHYIFSKICKDLDCKLTLLRA
ncbi:MAG: hypothetical protein HXS46_15740 [Theionarchaea archaeon]|nr:hypothetical protein [Theionarchaea archaeon]